MSDINLKGLINITTSDFSECIKANCNLLRICSNKTVNEIVCIYPAKLVKHTFEKKVIENNYAVKNTTTNTFLENIAKNVSGESTPTLTVLYSALSTNSQQITKNTILENEIGRVAITNSIRVGSSIDITSTFGLTDANTLDTTITSVTDEYTFDLASVVGLAVLDRIRINITNFGDVDRQIDDITSNTITLSDPLPLVPTIGDSAKQLITRIQLVAGGTLTLNSGTGVSIAPSIFTKSSTQTKEFIHTLRFI